MTKSRMNGYGDQGSNRVGSLPRTRCRVILFFQNPTPKVILKGETRLNPEPSGHRGEGNPIPRVILKGETRLNPIPIKPDFGIGFNPKMCRDRCLITFLIQS